MTPTVLSWCFIAAFIGPGLATKNTNVRCVGFIAAAAFLFLFAYTTGFWAFAPLAFAAAVMGIASWDDGTGEKSDEQPDEETS